jgi:putative transposase
MPNYRRAKDAGATYFFTVCTLNRQPLLTQEPFRIALHQAIERTRTTRPFTIDAWVLLPDHLHCLWTLPVDDGDFSARWAMIKQHTSKLCREHLALRGPPASRYKRHELGLWQRRFWEHRIRDGKDFSQHVDYIHWNPLKHGYVQRVADWPYSTFHRYAAQGVYPVDWAGMGHVELAELEFGE